MICFLSFVFDDLFVLTYILIILHGSPACAFMHAFAYIRVFTCIYQYLLVFACIRGVGHVATTPTLFLLLKTPAVRPSTSST